MRGRDIGALLYGASWVWLIGFVIWAILQRDEVYVTNALICNLKMMGSIIGFILFSVFLSPIGIPNFLGRTNRYKVIDYCGSNLVEIEYRWWLFSTWEILTYVRKTSVWDDPDNISYVETTTLHFELFHSCSVHQVMKERGYVEWKSSSRQIIVSLLLIAFLCTFMYSINKSTLLPNSETGKTAICYDRKGKVVEAINTINDMLDYPSVVSGSSVCLNLQ